MLVSGGALYHAAITLQECAREGCAQTWRPCFTQHFMFERHMNFCCDPSCLLSGGISFESLGYPASCTPVLLLSKMSKYVAGFGEMCRRILKY